MRFSPNELGRKMMAAELYAHTLSHGDSEPTGFLERHNFARNLYRYCDCVDPVTPPNGGGLASADRATNHLVADNDVQYILLLDQLLTLDSINRAARTIPEVLIFAAKKLRFQEFLKISQNCRALNPENLAYAVERLRAAIVAMGTSTDFAVLRSPLTSERINL